MALGKGRGYPWEQHTTVGRGGWVALGGLHGPGGGVDRPGGALSTGNALRGREGKARVPLRSWGEGGGAPSPAMGSWRCSPCERFLWGSEWKRFFASVVLP